MKKELLEEIEKLASLDKHQEIIDKIENLSAENLDSEIIGQLARAYNNIENYEKGLELLKSTEFEDGNTAKWNYRIGYSYFYLGNYEKTIEHFLKLEKILKENEELKEEFKDDIKYFLPMSYLNLARNSIDNGDSEKAFTYLEKGEKYIDDIESKNQYRISLAKFYNDTGKIEEAEKILKYVYENSEKTSTLISLIANNLEQQGKYEDALKYYLEIVERGEEDIYVLSEIGWIYDLLNETSKAKKYLNKAKKLGRDDAWITTEYAMIDLKEGRYKAGIIKFKKALALDNEKDEIFIYSKMGWAHRQLGEYNKALEAFFKVKDLGRNDEWLNIEIALAYEDKGEFQKALDIYLPIYEKDKDNIWLLTEIGWLYSKLEENEAALQFFLKAEELGRDGATFIANIGQCLGSLGRVEEGIERLKKALTMVDLNHENQIEDRIFIHSELAFQYGRLDEPNFEEALKNLYEAEKLGRDDSWINVEIAVDLLGIPTKDSEEHIKNIEEANRRYKKAVELGRNDASIYEELGTTAYDLGRYEEALEMYEKSYKLKKDGWVLAHIGLSERKLGKYEKAIKSLLKSRKISVEEGDVTDLEDTELAYCYAALGDKKKAEKYMNLALDSLGTLATDDENLKKIFDEIREMLKFLDKMA